MFVLTVLQTAVLPRFPILGLVPSLPFLAAVAWALLRGMNEGVVWAFLGGLLVDIFSVGPTGGAALTYMVAVVVVSLIAQALPANRFVLPILLAALATLVQQLLYFLFLWLLGYGTAFAMTLRLLPLALLHGVAVLPFYWSMYFVERAVWPRPVEV